MIAQPGYHVSEADVELTEYLESGTFAVIGAPVVDRAHRRQGIGAALMAEAEAWARAAPGRCLKIRRDRQV